MPFFRGTHLPVRHVDGFSRMMAQTTTRLVQGCAFLGIVHIAPHLAGQNPPKPPIWGRE